LTQARGPRGNGCFPHGHGLVAHYCISLESLNRFIIRMLRFALILSALPLSCGLCSECDEIEFLQMQMVTEALATKFSELKPAGLLESVQVPAKVIETSHTGWFSRLGDSIISVIIGFFVLIPFSLTLLCINEQRNARYESVVSLAESEVRTISHKSEALADAQLDGGLVHMDSGIVQGLDSMVDARFAAMRMTKGCVRMKSTVEAYQWQERATTTTTKDSLGGGKTTIKNFEYSKGWYSTVIDSDSFREPGGHENRLKVPHLPLGLQIKNNTKVMYGDNHYLPDDLVCMLENFTDASELVGPTIAVRKGPTIEVSDFTKRTSTGYFYCGANPGNPEIGDMQTRLEYVLDGPGTIMALQARDKIHGGCATFLPYRCVSRGICGISEDELCERLLNEGRKGYQELADDDMWICSCLCCCCNLVSWSFAHLAPPEVFHLFPAQLSREQVIDRLERQGWVTNWISRCLGWLLLYVGTYMFFQPLLVVLDIIPFLGPYISDGFSLVLSAIVLLITILLAILVVSVAYLRYRPVLGICSVAGVAAIVAALAFASKKLS